MIVAISYRKGVIYCEQYEKLDGNYYADFIRRNFQSMFQKSGKLPHIELCEGAKGSKGGWGIIISDSEKNWRSQSNRECF